MVAAAYRARGIEARTLHHATREQLQGWDSDGTLQRASVLHISTSGPRGGTRLPRLARRSNTAETSRSRGIFRRHTLP